mgnify:CR=1 FL=1
MVVSHVSPIRGHRLERFVTLWAVDVVWNKPYTGMHYHTLDTSLHRRNRTAYCWIGAFTFFLWYRALWLLREFLFLNSLLQRGQTSFWYCCWCWSLLCLFCDDLELKIFPHSWQLYIPPKAKESLINILSSNTNMKMLATLVFLNCVFLNRLLQIMLLH